MLPKIYNPFEDLTFDEHFCFLSGALTSEKLTVFPEWLMKEFNLENEGIELMDKTKTYRYSELKLPCSPFVKEAFEDLDKIIENAFRKGFDAMKALDEKLLFQWSGRIVYGLLYHEMVHERKRLMRAGKEFELSDVLKRRFGNFHLMLQSIFQPIEFVGRKPWSITVFPLKYSADILSFRDDVINLLFSFGVNGFGFIVCMQDNGVIGDSQEEILKSMENHVLHPVQFEELFARFHYSDYILQYEPEYKIESDGESLRIESLPILAEENRPVFGFWDEDIFAQLLSNYWSVYGIEREDILKFQKPPLSFLQNPYTKDFIDPEKIDLPF